MQGQKRVELDSMNIRDFKDKYVFLKKCKNKRPFHIRVYIAESERTGEVVKYKVPILDDYYNKLVWLRPKKFKKCKVLPLRRFKTVINETKEY